LAVGQTFHELEDGHQHQATGRQGRLPDIRKYGGKVAIIEQHAQFVADAHHGTRFGKCGAGYALRFGGNEITHLRMHGHRMLLL